MSRQVIRTVTSVKWKQVKDYPDFSVSNNGLVKGPKGLLHPREKGKYRYLWVSLRNAETGKFRHADIHRLVWDHFGTGVSPTKNLHIHHKDFNQHNNHIDNMELLTPLEHKAVHHKLG